MYKWYMSILKRHSPCYVLQLVADRKQVLKAANTPLMLRCVDFPHSSTACVVAPCLGCNADCY